MFMFYQILMFIDLRNQLSKYSSYLAGMALVDLSICCLLNFVETLFKCLVGQVTDPKDLMYLALFIKDLY